jgi:hypothetical protein
VYDVGKRCRDAVIFYGKRNAKVMINKYWTFFDNISPSRRNKTVLSEISCWKK